MRLVVALALLIWIVGFAVLFTWFAFAIRRDVKERFEQLGQRLERDATRLIRHLFSARP